MEAGKMNGNHSGRGPRISKAIQKDEWDRINDIIPTLKGIPRNNLSLLKVTNYDEAAGLIQLKYIDNLIPSPEISQERGKIYDIRTGTVVCAGSTYTHLALGDSIELDDSGNILYQEIDSEGTPIRVTDDTPLMTFPGYEFLTSSETEKSTFAQALNQPMSNLTNEPGVLSGNKTFIRPYSEGTHLSLFKHGGKVRLASHSNIDTRGSGATFFRGATGKMEMKISKLSKYQGVAFASLFDDGGFGFDNKSVFPVEGCFNSPYVYRFLICAPELSHASRVAIRRKAYLLFIGVHKVWNYDGEVPGVECPYQFGPVKNENDPRPYGGMPDNRSLDKVLDLASMARCKIVENLPPYIDEPIVYYPRKSFSLQECNIFLQKGFDMYLDQPSDLTDVDQRLWPGEALMMTTYYTKNGRKYVRNVKLMSESYKYRLDCHPGVSTLRGDMLNFSLRAGLPNAFPDDIPPIGPFDVEHIIHTLVNPAKMYPEGFHFLGPPSNLDMEYVRSFDIFTKRLASVLVYIYTCNPTRHLEAVTLFIDFLIKCDNLIEWIAEHALDESFFSGTIVDDLIKKSFAQTNYTYGTYLGIHERQNGSEPSDELRLQYYLAAAANTVRYQLNYKECDALIRYVSYDWSTEESAKKFRMPDITGEKQKQKKFTESEMRQFKRGPGKVNNKNKKNKSFHTQKK